MATNPFNNYLNSINKKTGVTMPIPGKANTLSLNSSTVAPAGMVKPSLTTSSNQGATAPVVPTPQVASGSSSSAPLPLAGQQFADLLVGRGNTPTQTTPQTAPTAPKPKTAYDRYVESLSSKDTKSYLDKKTSDAQRLADIQSRNDKQSLDTIAGREKILDKSGGLLSGARQSAEMFGRRATAESAYGAIEEGAAARTAGVSRDAYNDAIAQGKSAYEAEIEQEKANAKEGFSLAEGSTRFEFNPATGQYEQLAGGGTQTSGAYTPGANPEADAYVKAVQSGSIKLENVPQNIRGSVAQGLASSPETTDPKKQYVKSQANEALTNIDIALAKLQGEGTGAINTAGSPLGRALTGFIPGSDTRNLNAALTTVKSLVGFDALQKMRESSPTGGALGQITERELAFLQSVQGSLDTLQSNEQLIPTLNRVRQSFQTLQIVNSPDGTPFELNGQQYIKQGDQMIPQDFSQAGNASASNRPTRNNNPLNIKASNATTTYNGVSGLDPVPASDGGKFLVFNSPESGFNAAKRLIQTEGYKNLSVDSALKRWSNSGYGGEIVPAIADKKISQLSATELDTLIKTMAKREGYNA